MCCAAWASRNYRRTRPRSRSLPTRVWRLCKSAAEGPKSTWPGSDASLRNARSRPDVRRWLAEVLTLLSLRCTDSWENAGRGSQMVHPRLSVVVPCKGRLQHLRRSLPTFVAQPDSEVIVVDYDCPDK